MLQRVFRRLGHHTRCLWILDGLRFGRHCRAIDAEGARARIARSDRIERRDILEPLHLLRKLIEPGGLLRKLLHFLCSERFTGARSCDGIAVDRAVCRIWWGRRQGSGRCGAREGGLTATESAMDVAVERDVWEPVRRKEAARRGRFEGFVGGGVAAPIRAASWLSEGRRPADEGRSGFEWSGPGCEAVDEFALMAGLFVVAATHKSQPRSASCLFYYFILIKVIDLFSSSSLYTTYQSTGTTSGAHPRYPGRDHSGVHVQLTSATSSRQPEW